MRDLDGVTIVFDLDGTLVDTAPDLLRVLDEVLTREGAPVPPYEEARLMIGHGARVMIERAATRAGLAWPEEKLTSLTADFVEIYAADIARESRPFPGLEAALDALKAAGARLSVCTNKRTGLSELLLAALGLAHRFDAIVGADVVTAKKPAADHYVAAVTRAGGDVGRSVMVGDSAADVGAARAAGAPVIAVTFGYCEEGVDALGADALISSYDELGAVARRLVFSR